MANEKRLIDANEFWNRLSNVVYDIFTVHEKDGRLTNTASVGYYTETIQEVLKQTKPVDAVKVVRCKDCKHFGGHGVCHCHAADENGTPIFVREDDFCSYGERREEE